MARTSNWSDLWESKIFPIIKWGVLIIAYGALLYTLLAFRDRGVGFDEWCDHLRNGQWHWGVGMLLLIPVNWALEALKWQRLTRQLEYLGFGNALKAVLRGCTVAFFTPNRIGEYPGRCVFLSEGNRARGISLGVVGAMSQTGVVMMGGIPASLVYLADSASTYALGIALLVLCLTTYFLLPQLGTRLQRLRPVRRWEKYLAPVSRMERCQLTEVLLISMARYVVFCTQFYLLLRFFGVNLNGVEGAMGIATNYLFVTFTPSMLLSEGAVRASMGVAVFTLLRPVTEDAVAVMCASVSVWLLNYVLPMLVGSYFWLRKH